MLVAKTTFGKGVSFMEQSIKWHYWPLSEAEHCQALGEVGAPRTGVAADENCLRGSALEAAECEPRVLLLTGDLGFMVLEPFRERFPGRFFNVGVAEQNLVGLATGLAEAGFIPFVYSIANFAVLRPLEFIRNGPLLHRLPVRIAGIGDGFDYGTAGATHHSLEDVGVLRTFPGMTIVAPANPAQTKAAVRALLHRDGPVYFRLGKARGRLAPGLDEDFDPERVPTVRNGDDVLLLSLGGMCGEALEAAERLEATGLSAAVAVVPCVNPAPAAALLKHISGFPLVATVEAHFTSNGLGSLVAEVIADNGLSCRLLRIGVSTPLGSASGCLEHLKRQHGLDAQAIADRVLAAWVPRG